MFHYSFDYWKRVYQCSRIYGWNRCSVIYSNYPQIKKSDTFKEAHKTHTYFNFNNFFYIAFVLCGDSHDVTTALPGEELIYGKATQHQESKVIIEKTTEKGIDIGAAVGVALAVVLSYTKWQSIGWAIFHGLLNWVYVIYYVIRY